MASGGGGDHIIEIIIETADHTSPGMQRAAERLLAFDRRVQQTQQRIRQLTNRGHRVTLDFIDNVTPAGSRINSTLRRLADRAWRIPLRLNDSTASGIREVEARLFRLTGRAYNVAVGIKENASEKLKDFGSGIGGAGAELLGMAGMGLGIADTVNTYKDFEAEMSRVGAISGASADELDQLTGAAMEMGAQSQYGATDAAKALEYMAMAGWKTEQMIAGLPGVIGLAEASGEDLAMVSDVVTDALTAFGLQASDAAHFADVLAATASNANTDIGKLGYTFKYVAPLAGALKYSIEDVSLAAGLMANAGIKGEQAGTSLRNIMTNLVDPSKEAATALESVGLSADFIRNADGTVKPFRQTLMDLRTAFSGLTDAQKAEAASAIAGAEGMSGFLAMVNAAEKDVGNLATVLDNAEGSTQRMSDAMGDNLAGDLENLGGAFETFQLRLMKGTPSNFLREFVQGVTEDIDKLNEYMEDGLDLSDIGKVAMDVITQLKNKFLELDGVGSVLAGGALIGGIGLITSKAMKLIDVLKGAANPEGGSGGSGGGFGGGHGQSVGVMNVKANVVNLSGSHGPAGGGAGPIPPGGPHGGGNGGPNPPPGGGGASRLARGLKLAGGIGTVLSLASSAYDVYATGQYNEKMDEEADWGIQTAQKRFSETNDAAWEANEAYKRGEISLEERDKAYADWANAEADFNGAMDYQERVDQQNTDRQNQSIGGMVGGVVGGVLGGIAGSAVAPGAGTAVGAMAGSVAGAEVGEMVGANWTSLTEGAGEMWDSLKAEAGNTAEWMGNKFSEFGTSVGEKLSPIREAAQNEWDYLKNSAGEAAQGVSEKWDTVSSFMSDNVWTPVQDAAITGLNFMVGLFAAFGGLIGEALAPVASWIDENVWTPIREFAAETWDSIVATVSEKAEEISTAFGELSAWMDENVWTPVQESASEAWAGISELPGEAVAYISELWSGVTAWFSEAVWTPLGDMASAAWETVSSTVGAAWDSMVAYFGPAASWFDSTVWQPIASAVGSVQTAISSAFEAAWSAVTGIWAQAGAWFESNVIAPIKEKFSAITSLGASITGLSTSGGNEAPHASGGVFHTPHRGIVAEAGPEAIIPLTSGRRSRAIDLWEKVGQYFGMGVHGDAQENSGTVLSAIRSESKEYTDVAAGMGDSGLQQATASERAQSQSYAQGRTPSAGTVLDSGQMAMDYTAATASERAGQYAPMEDLPQSFAGIAVPDYNMVDAENDDFTVQQAKLEAQRKSVLPEVSPSWGESGGEERAATAPIVEQGGNRNASQEIRIDVGGLSLSMEIHSDESNPANPDAIMAVIRENFGKLADDVAGHLAEKCGDIWNNRPVPVITQAN